MFSKQQNFFTCWYLGIPKEMMCITWMFFIMQKLDNKVKWTTHNIDMYSGFQWVTTLCSKKTDSVSHTYRK